MHGARSEWAIPMRWVIAAATALGLFSTLQAYLGSLYVNDFNRFGRQWKVYIQGDSQYRVRPEDMGQFFVRNGDGGMVPLSTLVTTHGTNGPEFTVRFNLFRAAEITGLDAANALPTTAPPVTSMGVRVFPQARITEPPRERGEEHGLGGPDVGPVSSNRFHGAGGRGAAPGIHQADQVADEEAEHPPPPHRARGAVHQRRERAAGWTRVRRTAQGRTGGSRPDDGVRWRSLPPLRHR